MSAKDNKNDVVRVASRGSTSSNKITPKLPTTKSADETKSHKKRRSIVDHIGTANNSSHRTNAAEKLVDFSHTASVPEIREESKVQKPNGITADSKYLQSEESLDKFEIQDFVDPDTSIFRDQERE